MTVVNAPDPADIRLLAVLAEEGRGAVHELAAKLGMDPREAVTRLINLSATGLPLVVGAECDQAKLRDHLAAMQAQQQPGGQQAAPKPPGGPTSAGPFRTPAPGAPAPPGQSQPPIPGQPPAGARPGRQVPPPSVPNPAFPGQAPQANFGDGMAPQASANAPHAPQAQQSPLGTWGPPQSSAWARGDEQIERGADGAGGSNGTEGSAGPRNGRVGDKLHTTGLQGDPISIRLVEVVDPADSLYTAAGHTLGETERTIVVHTELTNHGWRSYNTPPDQYLVLQTADGNTIGKAPISLASRPPHTIGVPAGETVGGHAVYVLNQRTRILEVRWLARPDSMQHSLTWQL